MTLSRKSLPELTVDGFDDEQIWQQIELENEDGIQALLLKSASLLSRKGTCSFSQKHNNKPQDTSHTNVKTVKKKKGKKTDLVQDDDTSDEEGHAMEENVEGLEQFNQEASGDEDILGEDMAEEEIDPNDKFFDFTGDSDEDLQYGPLGQGNLEKELFDGDESEDSDSERNSKKNKGKKKSVTFDDGFPQSEMDNKNDFHRKVPKRKSIVDDKFFKLAELEKFLDAEDEKEERRRRREERAGRGEEPVDESDDDDDEIDMFAEINSEDEVPFIAITMMLFHVT